MLNKRGNRGQVTIFIIIAILIIAVVVLFFVFRGEIKREVISPEVTPIKNFVQECLEDTAEDVILRVGEGGGYYFPPEKSTETGITYYFYNNKSYLPSKEKIENEISFFISEKLFFCTRNFIDFPEYEISQGKINVEIKILEDEIKLNVEYPLIIQREESKSRIKDFEAEIPVRVGIIYNSINQFANENSPEKGICLSCLLNISETNDLYVDMFDYDNRTTIFIFKDENSIINEKPFEWVFANRY